MAEDDGQLNFKCPIDHDWLDEPISLPCCGQAVSRKNMLEWGGPCPMCTASLHGFDVASAKVQKNIQAMVEAMRKKSEPAAAEEKHGRPACSAVLVPLPHCYNTHPAIGLGHGSAAGSSSSAAGSSSSGAGSSSLSSTSSASASASPSAAGGETAASGRNPVAQLRINLGHDMGFKTLLVLVADKSGSMAQVCDGHPPPIRQMLYSINQLIDQTFSLPHLLTSIVLYDDDHVRVDIDKTNGYTAEMYKHQVAEHCKKNGGTSFKKAYEGMLEACKMATRRKDVSSVKVLFLTDGSDSRVVQPEERKDLLKEIGDALREKKIANCEVHTIGFGGPSTADFSFLDGLRTLCPSEGVYRHANPALDIDALSSTINSVISRLTDRPAIPIQLLPSPQAAPRDLVTALSHQDDGTSMDRDGVCTLWVELAPGLDQTAPVAITVQVGSSQPPMELKAEFQEIHDVENTVSQQYFQYLIAIISQEIDQMAKEQADRADAINRQRVQELGVDRTHDSPTVEVSPDMQLHYELLLCRCRAVLAHLKTDSAGAVKLRLFIENIKTLRTGRKINRRQFNDMRFENKFAAQTRIAEVSASAGVTKAIALSRTEAGASVGESKWMLLPYRQHNRLALVPRLTSRARRTESRAQRRQRWHAKQVATTNSNAARASAAPEVKTAAASWNIGTVPRGELAQYVVASFTGVVGAAGAVGAASAPEPSATASASPPPPQASSVQVVQGPGGMTILMAAVCTGRIEAVQCILQSIQLQVVQDVLHTVKLDCTAYINLCNADSHSATELAALYGYHKIYRLLKDRGGVIYADRRKLLQTCLHRAHEFALSADEDYETALLDCRSLTMAETLLREGFVVVDADMMRNPPSSELLLWLGQKSKQEITLESAIQMGLPEEVEQRLIQLRQTGKIPPPMSWRALLHLLHSNKHLQVFKVMMEYNLLDPDERMRIRSEADDDRGDEVDLELWPLFIASQRGHAPLVRVLLHYLERRGQAVTGPGPAADGSAVQTVPSDVINRRNEKGTTALWIAAYKKHLDVVLELVNAGADPNIANARGDGPLVGCCQWGATSVLSMLLEAGARVDVFNPRRDNLLIICCRHGRDATLRQLCLHIQRRQQEQQAAQQRHSSSVSVAAAETESKESIANSSASPSDKTLEQWFADQAEIDGFNAMLSAVESNRPDCISVLKQFGCSLETRTADDNGILPGATPLHLACWYGKTAAAERLLELGADMYASTTVGGFTALHLSVKKCQPDLVRLLFQRDAGKRNLNVLDSSGRLPAYYASMAGNQDIQDEFFTNHLMMSITHILSTGDVALIAKACDVLLQYGRSPSCFDYCDILSMDFGHGVTLLTIALLTMNDYLLGTIVKMNVTAAAHQVDEDGISPLFWMTYLQQTRPELLTESVWQRLRLFMDDGAGGDVDHGQRVHRQLQRLKARLSACGIQGRLLTDLAVGGGGGGGVRGLGHLGLSVTPPSAPSVASATPMTSSTLGSSPSTGQHESKASGDGDGEMGRARGLPLPYMLARMEGPRVEDGGGGSSRQQKSLSIESKTKSTLDADQASPVSLLSFVELIKTGHPWSTVKASVLDLQTWNAMLLDAQIHVIKTLAAAEDLPKGLNAMHIMALRLFSSSGEIADQVNQLWLRLQTRRKTRESQSQSDQANQAEHARMQFMQCLSQGLDLLPPYQGEVYRGIRSAFDREVLDIGSVIEWNYFASGAVDWAHTTSFLHNAASGAGQGNTIFLIHSKTRGKRLAQFAKHPVDGEVVFRPNTKFKVINHFSGSVISLGQPNIRNKTYKLSEHDYKRASSFCVVVELEEV